MKRPTPIVGQRLHNQYITRAAHCRPADLVAWLGAVQAQEYPFAKWGLALRMRDGNTDAEIERACSEGEILRTHVMRPTWHFVNAADIRWMLELTGPRVLRVMATYYQKLELDTKTLTRGTAVIEKALGDRSGLTRNELAVHLARSGLAAKGPRLAMVAMYAELEGVICSGPHRGKVCTYSLVAHRAPQARRLPRDEALAELARRYFTSHGPATVGDFVWWSGLLTGDARRGLEMIGAESRVSGDHTYWWLGSVAPTAARRPLAHLLPIYDEFLVAYRRREAMPHGPSTIASPSHGTITFQHALVIGGRVVGTWKTRRVAMGLSVDVFPLRRLAAAERRAVAAGAERYGRFRGEPVSLSFADPPTPRRNPARSL